MSFKGTSASHIPKKQPPKKPSLLPPIIAIGQDSDELVDALDEITTGEFWIKNTTNTVVIHTKHMSDYQAILRALEEDEIKYHKYSAEAKKTHTFVFRGMTPTRLKA